MTDALNTLPPEAVAIIKEGTPKPQVAAPALQVSPFPKDEQKVPEPPSSEPAIEIAPKPKPPKAKPAPLGASGLVSLNFRLPAELPMALFKASADRKMQRIRPFTQQDIIAEALTDWLRKNKYMP